MFLLSVISTGLAMIKGINSLDNYHINYAIAITTYLGFAEKVFWMIFRSQEGKPEESRQFKSASILEDFFHFPGTL